MLLLFIVLTCTIHTIKSEIDKALGNKYAYCLGLDLSEY